MIPGLGLSRVLRLVVRVAVALVVVTVGYVGVTAAQVWWTSRRNDAVRAQAIVVMGAAQYNGVPSEVLAARLSHALDLWRAHLAPKLVVTGGGEPGDRYTEAEASALWLEARGVPDSDVLREVQGRDSYESLAGAAAFLHPRGISSVLMVSDPFHEERITAIAAGLGLTPYPSPTRTSPIRGTAELGYFGRETVAVAAGRIIGYRRLSNLLHGVVAVTTAPTGGL